MSKEIIAVYQDCVLCGDKGRKKITEFAKKGMLIRKVGFTTPEGRDLTHRAVFEHKIGSMPFFTDGKRFSTSLEDLSDEPNRKNMKKPAKKVRKNMKEPEDVAI